MQWKSRLRVFWREWVKPILIVVIVLGALRSAVADWYDVPTGSMKPSIIEGDRIFVNKLAYDLKVPFTHWRLARWGEPKRGDVVVFYAPQNETRMVKRVIGIAGDEIELRGNRLWVNGEAVEYEPLDPDVVDQLSEAERGQHRYAAEDLDGRAHPMMTTPRLKGKPYFGPVVVPAGHVLVMGDNRDASLDSRFWGFVDADSILGRASRVVLSVDKDHFYRPRWHRFFRQLP
jgi:signal peptidase I